MTTAEYRAHIAANTLECDVQAAIVNYLTLRGIPHSVTDASANARAQRRFINKGWPDVTGCYPGTGQLLAIECKRGAGGRLSREQADTLHRLWLAGALVVIPRSLDDLIAALESGKAPQATLDEIAAALAKGKKKTK